MQIAYNLVAVRRLERALREFRPDLIYERYALYGFVGVWTARRWNIPLILEVNTPYAQAWAKYFGLYFETLARWIERRTLLGADYLVTVTGAQRDMLVRDGTPAERIAVCHNAIDPLQFAPDRLDRAAVRARLGLEGTVIGFVGTMNRWQGMADFPKVIDAVLRDCAEASFLLVGDGEFRPLLEQAATQGGWGDRVVFTGRKRHGEIPELVAAMDITVLLNSNDYGSPMKLFEYFAMGKAVIAPSVGPVREVLRDGGTGLLIRPGDVDAMVASITRLVRNDGLREDLGKAARDYVVAHHTWSGNARRVLAVYDQLSTRRGSAAER